MKRMSRNILTLGLAMAMILSIFCINATARSSDYISAYSASCTASSGRRITVTVDIDALRYMTNVGASTIVIYHSTDRVDWYPVMTYNYETYSNMMHAGYYYCEDAVIYYGTAGHYYRAMVYCYAGDATGGDTRTYTTSYVKCVA